MIERVANRQKKVAVGDNNFRMLVTNQNEVLALDGIHGKIANVGAGFGTGRHTASVMGRRNQRMRSQEKDAEYSIKIKAQCPGACRPFANNDPPCKWSVGIGCSPKSINSNRSKNEGVSVGRFEPSKFDTDAQTGAELLREHPARGTNEFGTETDPVIIEYPRRSEMVMVQTDPMVVENSNPFEPEPCRMPVSKDHKQIP